MRQTTQWDVLLVENNPADIYLVQKALAQWEKPIRLWSVPNGQDALGFLRKEGSYGKAPSPALILLELKLPQLHGHRALAALRRLPPHARTPVVIFSAARKEVEEHRCLQLGANQYVQKPSDLPPFLAAIRAIVERWLKP